MDFGVTDVSGNISSSNQSIDLDDFEIVDECSDKEEIKEKSSIFGNFIDVNVSKGRVNNSVDKRLQQHTHADKLNEDVNICNDSDVMEVNLNEKFSTDIEISRNVEVTECTLSNEKMQPFEEIKDSRCIFIDIKDKKPQFGEIDQHSFKNTESSQQCYEDMKSIEPVQDSEINIKLEGINNNEQFPNKTKKSKMLYAGIHTSQQGNQQEGLSEDFQNNEPSYGEIGKNQISCEGSTGLDLCQNVSPLLNSYAVTDDKNIEIHSETLHQSDAAKASDFEIDLDDLFIVDSVENVVGVCEKGKPHLKSDLRVLDDHRDHLITNSNKSKDLIFKEPGEDIKDGSFSRVVIAGDSSWKERFSRWPSDSIVKPYFLWKEQFSVKSDTEEFLKHPYLCGSYRVILFIITSFNDFLRFVWYRKSSKCLSKHPPYLRSISFRSYVEVSYLINYMRDIKSILDREGRISIVFSCFPECESIENTIQAIKLTKHNDELCRCVIRNFASRLRESERNLIEFSRTVNRLIRFRKLNAIANGQVFDLLPSQFSILEKKFYCPREVGSTIDFFLVLSIILRNIILKESSCKNQGDENSSTFNNYFSYINKKMILNEGPIKFIIVGDSWLKVVDKSWPSTSSITPLILYKDNISFEDMKKLIFTSVDSDEERTFIIVTLPSKEFLVKKTYHDCIGHKPISFPIPHGDIHSNPYHLLKDILGRLFAFHEDVKRRVKNCKIMYTTCYPIIFEMYYKYLTDLHYQECGHRIRTKFVKASEAKINRRKLKFFLNFVNNILNKVNELEGITLSCNIHSGLLSLSEPRFLYPVYISDDISPDSLSSNMLTVLIKTCIESLMKYNDEESVSCDSTESTSNISHLLGYISDMHSINSIFQNLTYEVFMKKMRLHFKNLETFIDVNLKDTTNKNSRKKNDGLIDKRSDFTDEICEKNKDIAVEDQGFNLSLNLCTNLQGSDIYEIPGQDIENANFLRLVVVSSTNLENMSSHWPSESKIKPYFLWSRQVCLNFFSKTFMTHRFMQGTKQIIVLFVMGVQELVSLGNFKSPKCPFNHPPLCRPKYLNCNSHMDLCALINEMLSLKHEVKSKKSISLVYSYIPDFDIVRNNEQILKAARSQYFSCTCWSDQENIKLDEIARNLKELSVNFNFMIKQKKLNVIDSRHVFDYLPLPISFLDNQWVSVEREDITFADHLLMLKSKLNRIIFGATSDQYCNDIDQSILDKESKYFSLHTIKNYDDVKVILVGDSWLKAVYTFWPHASKNKPLILYKDNISFDEMEKFILASVLADEKTLVIATVPSKYFLTEKFYSGCIKHEPVAYPVPCSQLLSNPYHLFTSILEKIRSFHKEIKTKLKNCKVVYTTCYPIVFEMYYKHIVSNHYKLVYHSIKDRFVAAGNAKINRKKVGAFMNILNTFLAKVNKNEGFLYTCNIYRELVRLPEPRFLYPVYVESLSPDLVASKKLSSFIEKYINWCLLENTQQPAINWKCTEELSDINNLCGSFLDHSEVNSALECSNSLLHSSHKFELSLKTMSFDSFARYNSCAINSKSRQDGGRDRNVVMKSDVKNSTSNQQSGYRDECNEIVFPVSSGQDVNDYNIAGPSGIYSKYSSNRDEDSFYSTNWQYSNYHLSPGDWVHSECDVVWNCSPRSSEGKIEGNLSDNSNDSVIIVNQPSNDEDGLKVLWDEHNREYEVYKQNPSLHPDYGQSRVAWFETMANQGFSMFDPNLGKRWSTYWNSKIDNLLQITWEDKRIHHLRKRNINLRKKRKTKDSSSKSCHRKRKRKIESQEEMHKTFWKYKEADIPNSTLNSVEDLSSKNVLSSFKEVTFILSQISESFGENIGPSLKALHNNVCEAIDKKRDPLVFVDDDSKMLLDLVKDKLTTILSDKSLSVVKRSIVLEVFVKLKSFLESFEMQNSSRRTCVLDIKTIARLTTGKEDSDILRFIENTLMYKKIANVSIDEVKEIFSDVKKAQKELICNTI